MTKETWNKFIKIRRHFRSIVEDLSESLPNLKTVLEQFVSLRSDGGNYKIETPVVYNTALDDIKIDDEIKLILVADNPGRREQASENRRYLVGPSGKIADKFLKSNPSLGIDFHKNVIILNKTPIHSPRTIELRKLCSLDADNSISAALEKSQKAMAALLFAFHEVFSCPVWITGYSEMRKNGLFEVYTNSLKELYNNNNLFRHIFIYRHFSMNQFTIDLKQRSLPDENIIKSLERIGTFYRQKILFYK